MEMELAGLCAFGIVKKIAVGGLLVVADELYGELAPALLLPATHQGGAQGPHGSRGNPAGNGVRFLLKSAFYLSTAIKAP
jgi:hypothetical protein